MPLMLKIYSTMNEPVIKTGNKCPNNVINGKEAFLNAWCVKIRCQAKPFARAVRM